MKNLESCNLLELSSSEMVVIEGGLLLPTAGQINAFCGWIKQEATNCVNEFKNVMKQCHC